LAAVLVANGQIELVSICLWALAENQNGAYVALRYRVFLATTEFCLRNVAERRVMSSYDAEVSGNVFHQRKKAYVALRYLLLEITIINRRPPRLHSLA